MEVENLKNVHKDFLNLQSEYSSYFLNAYFMGDFNADCTYFPSRTFNNFLRAGKLNFGFATRWLINSPTNLFQYVRRPCKYDRYSYYACILQTFRKDSP